MLVLDGNWAFELRPGPLLVVGSGALLSSASNVLFCKVDGIIGTDVFNYLYLLIWTFEWVIPKFWHLNLLSLVIIFPLYLDMTLTLPHLVLLLNIPDITIVATAKFRGAHASLGNEFRQCFVSLACLTFWRFTHGRTIWEDVRWSRALKVANARSE